jgi:Protein of unknown function (DUF3052)
MAGSVGYSGTPLPRKLGIKEGTTVVLVAAPERFERALGALPEGVVLRRGNRGARGTTIWFVRSRRELEQRWDPIAQAVGEGTLWIAWPKQSSPLAGDVSEDTVREVALPRGLVDTKVCAIDEDWSGLRLTRRRSKPK